jgi:type II secretory pathway component PulM
MQWWLQLEVQERRTLLIGGGVLSIILIYFVFWVPWQQMRIQLSSQVQQAQTLNIWMHDAARQIQQFKLQNNKQPKQILSQAQLLTQVEHSLRQSSLAEIQHGIEPRGKKLVRVYFQRVNFQYLVKWLNTFQTQTNIMVLQAEFTRKSETGMTQAQIILSY